MDDAVRGYVDAIDPAYRPLFDRIHRLIPTARPDASVALSYQIPAYKAGRRRLYVGAWRPRVNARTGPSGSVEPPRTTTVSGPA